MGRFHIHLFLSLIYFSINTCNTNLSEPLHYKYSKMANNQTVHDRKKRFVLIFCLNFPNCCDFKGQDICGMPCPPCPKKKKEPKGYGPPEPPPQANAGSEVRALPPSIPSSPPAVAGIPGFPGSAPTNFAGLDGTSILMFLIQQNPDLLRQIVTARGANQLSKPTPKPKPGSPPPGPTPDAVTVSKLLMSNPILLKMFLENKTPSGDQSALLGMLASNPQLLSALAGGAGGAGGSNAGGGIAAILQNNPGLLASLGGGGGGGGIAAILQNNPGLLASLTGGGGNNQSQSPSNTPQPQGRQNFDITTIAGGSGSGGGSIGAFLQNNPGILSTLSQAMTTASPPTTTTTTTIPPKSNKFQSSPSNLIDPVRVLPPFKIISSSTTASPQRLSTTVAPSKSPSGIDLSAFLKNPAVQKLVQEYPQITEDFNKASKSGDLIGLLGNPIIAKFVQENPSVVSDFLNGPSGGSPKFQVDASINEALASLAAPPPPGAVQGVFGADIFAGEDLDVAGFSYDDEENELDEDDIYGDFEGNSVSASSSTLSPITKPPSQIKPVANATSPDKSPSGIDLSVFLKNPAVKKLTEEYPQITEDFNKASKSGDLVGLLANPIIAKFVQQNPSVVSDFLNGPSDGKPQDPNINDALASLAAPPPPGVPVGAFGPDLFAGEEFDVAGFDYDDEDIPLQSTTTLRPVDRPRRKVIRIVKRHRQPLLKKRGLVLNNGSIRNTLS